MLSEMHYHWYGLPIENGNGKCFKQTKTRPKSRKQQNTTNCSLTKRENHENHENQRECFTHVINRLYKKRCSIQLM